MGQPSSIDARLFDRVALQRFEDARFLLDGNRTSGAVYPGGYAAECVLKALILSITPTRKAAEILESFRGNRGHSFDSLRSQYHAMGGAGFPPPISKAFKRIRTWGTELRYQPGLIPLEEARAFLAAVEEFSRWARERI